MTQAERHIDNAYQRVDMAMGLIALGKAHALLGEALHELHLASADTHAERCDVKQAQPARVGSAVGNAETPKPSQGAEQQQCRSGR